MPFTMVERPGFLKIINTAAPHYKVPSRNYFSKTEIPNLYNTVKADVKNSLVQGEYFAATTDLWTSERGGGEPYISFTVHYITPGWQLASHCLETLFFPHDHTAQNIAEFFENMLEEWDITKTSLVSVTTDNAANMTKAFEDFPELWLGCFGHNLIESGHIKGSEDAESGHCSQGLSASRPSLLEELEEKKGAEGKTSGPQPATEGPCT